MTFTNFMNKNSSLEDNHGALTYIYCAKFGRFTNYESLKSGEATSWHVSTLDSESLRLI